jgi:hypothetical protein
MSLKILKFNYRFREEIIIKLSEYMQKVISLNINSLISHQLINILKFINQKE